ncbi:MAG: 50S ribosomal protein L30 [Candidatus Wallbacteria bacterium HGW-Wallbacteria-1]|jgi:large subunit ribosomal protein L30|uniref:50S ribosomal protein L30 n=1 Tax=Candidatus Wallbacteria bacterium HGW-Wallbacteria-1 TaxID=2013854 RepID=A0A2N1PSU4_9BACT|nr:MAG: 50S ribosomal protein L30 [Candidatus Wallbacteria bacterium HGW-Wallbacteria-1]
MSKKLEIKLVKSPITENPKARKTLVALGLRKKINRVVVHEDTPQIRGMIAKTSHLVEVREVENS